MKEYRVLNHPILPTPERKQINIFWQGQKLSAYAGETIAAALIANHIHIFGYHPKDGSPQGIFCANGQCSQCMVLANGKPVKSCMEQVVDGQRIEPLCGLPELPTVENVPHMGSIPTIKIPALIVGGGPAGLSAGIELGQLGIPCLLVDDKHRLGGKLVLQTHRFFGSSQAVYAGTRGIDIATRLECNLAQFSSVEIWLRSTVLAVFSDHKVGVLKDNSEYVLVEPQVLLIAAGAREKFLAFPGNTLPGVYGAGAFQTLVNRDLIRPADNLFIVGGGNVGLIAGYHALQAGIHVAGLAEALAECGGYKVHKDKLVRMGVPIFTSHSILQADGRDHVESATIINLDAALHPIPGTKKTFACDSILIAIGLNPVNEFYLQAQDFGLPVFAAGDAEEIAEASAAIFSGRIKGQEIARFLKATNQSIPEDWQIMADILKSRPGKLYPERLPVIRSGVLPILHCTQEIPCDPCTTLCPQNLIALQTDDIRSIPHFQANAASCIRCEKCVAGCPGLAITLVDFRKDPENPIVSIPFECTPDLVFSQKAVTTLDMEGNVLGKNPVVKIVQNSTNDRTCILRVQAPAEYAVRIAGIRTQDPAQPENSPFGISPLADETIVCRCERVTAGELRSLIQAGYRDVNEIKTVSRTGMGACGGKTCASLIEHLFQEEGISSDDVTPSTKRPLFTEVPLHILAGVDEGCQSE